jgi:hypothetical protein
MTFETLRFQMIFIDSKIVVTNSNQIVITIVFIEMQNGFEFKSYDQKV